MGVNKISIDEAVRGVGTRWLTFWISTVLPAVVVFSWLRVAASGFADASDVSQVTVKSVLCLATSNGLWRRRRWAWYVNWVVMLGLPLMALLMYTNLALESEGVEVLVASGVLGAWLVPNAIYFYKREHLFK